MAREHTELHFHLLPGVDDGPRTVGESLDLAAAAVADGTAHVVCTPHAHRIGGGDELHERVGELRAALAAAGIALAIAAGAELSPQDVAGLPDRDLEAMAQGPPGARWALLEAPLDDLGVADLEAAAAEVRARGYGVLLAHPERSPQLRAAPEALARLRAAGAVVQVNATSLTGLHGEAPRAAALELVRSGVAATLASDAHGADRPPSLTAAAAVLVAHGLPGAADLVTRAPAALLRHGIPPATAARAA